MPANASIRLLRRESTRHRERSGRLKVTVFGFARIAAPNKEGSHRLTFAVQMHICLPRSSLVHECDLSTDIFSLGVILAEIVACHLADDTHFAGSAISFAIDAEEVRYAGLRTRAIRLSLFSSLSNALPNILLIDRPHESSWTVSAPSRPKCWRAQRIKTRTILAASSL